MFNVKQYLHHKVPGDLTLGETKVFILSLPELKTLYDMVKKDKTIRIRFLRADGTECSDDMPIGVFRQLEGATVAIDDQSGGIKVKEKA